MTNKLRLWLAVKFCVLAHSCGGRAGERLESDLVGGWVGLSFLFRIGGGTMDFWRRLSGRDGRPEGGHGQISLANL